jgi:hypothetical protein
MTRRAWAILGLCWTAPFLAGTAAAQKLTLTLNSGAPVAFPSPTPVDYDNTYVYATAPIAYTVDLNSGPPGVNRTTIVSIRAGSAVMGGSKPIGDMEFRAATGPWTALTTANQTVESRPIVRNGTNDPWSSTIEFRVKLGWTTDAPASYTPTVILTMTLTTP